MSKARELADFVSAGNPLSDGAISVAEISDITASATELNKLDGVTASTAELNTMTGITATTSDLNNVAGINTSVQTQLDGKQAVVSGVSDTEIGYLDGVTSALQTQLDNISVTSGSLTKSFTSGETASITLAQAISPAPVVSATKEVSQVGISSKGAWDVNATASNYELHNTAYDTTLTPTDIGFGDISGASYDSVSLDTSSEDASVSGITFNNDGTSLYFSSFDTDLIYQYSLSTAYDISTASYANKSFDVSSQNTQAWDVKFNNDGTKMYVVTNTGDSIYQYSLSTSFDVSTASYDSVSAYLGSQNLTPTSFFFNNDGTKLILMGSSNSAVFQYSLSTPYDISTLSYDNVSFSTAPQVSYIQGIALNNDGTKLFIVDGSAAAVFQYSFSTAYDVSTLSYDNISFSIGSQETNAFAIAFNALGTKMYIGGNGTNYIYQYSVPIGSSALVLGTGSFASTDVGKRIQGNGGDVTLASTAGAYDTTGGSAFTDNSTIASGSWSMRGLKSAGDADGIGFTGISSFYDMGNASYDSVTFSFTSQEPSPEDMAFSNDGTKLYMIGNDNGGVFQYSLSTAFDLSTISYDNVKFGTTSQIAQPEGLTISPNGTKMHILDKVYKNIYEYTLSTAFDVSTASYSNQNLSVSAQEGSPRGFKFSNDGTKMYVVGVSNDTVFQYSLVLPFVMATASYANKSFEVGSQEVFPEDLVFNSDGTKMYIVGRGSSTVFQYSLSTAFDVSTASYDSVSFSVGSQDTTPLGLSLNNDGSKMYMIGTSGDSIYQYSTLNASIPTSQYNIGVTNSGGQIDTNFWTDINSMTADQTAGDGTVHYAVSTDDRTTWSVAKASDGVRPIVRDNAGTWQYNNDAGATVGGTLESPSFVQSYYTNNQPGTSEAVAFSSDGTQMYVGGYTPATIFQYTLSTAWNISTASYSSKNYDHSGENTGAYGLSFKPDGTKMYILDGDENIDQYSLSTAWDVSTASYDSKTISINSVDRFGGGINFKPDGTLLYFAGSQNGSVYALTLSTAWDISTLNTSSYTTFSTSSSNAYPQDMVLNSDGTRMFTIDSTNVYQYNLSTAYDLSTATYSNLNFSLSSQATSHRGIYISSDDTKLFTASAVDYVYEYSITGNGYGTGTTWTNATTNDEFYSLQQALGASEFNRMDKTQLDAVADGSHFTLGDTLDLAIALRQDTASGSTPKSDGVSINYDAQALNQGAVLGTDYDYDFPDSTTVRVTSNAAQNLKVRVV